MSKTLIIVLVIVALVALVGGGLAWAKHRGYCRNGGIQWVQERISSRLELNQTQEQKLSALGDTLMGLRSQWMETRDQRRNELTALLDAPSLDRERATSLLEGWHRNWAERGPELVTAFADFSDSLSTEQREQLRELIEKRRGWHRPGWSH
jgi:Spy/CpxP family protein refolding chaperone